MRLAVQWGRAELVRELIGRRHEAEARAAPLGPSAGDDDALIPLFCVATLLLRSARAGLDAIDPEYYSKLMTYMTNMLDEKAEEAARETGREGIN